jgi:hypothetical protein
VQSVFLTLRMNGVVSRHAIPGASYNKSAVQKVVKSAEARHSGAVATDIVATPGARDQIFCQISAELERCSPM